MFYWILSNFVDLLLGVMACWSVGLLVAWLLGDLVAWLVGNLASCILSA